MSKMVRSLMLLTAVSLALGLESSAAETKPASRPVAGASEPAGELSPEAMMEMFAAMGAPGDRHAHFEQAVGKWKTRTTMRMGPDAPEQQTSGECEFEVILGGRFLQQRCTGEMMGMKYEGIGIEGYDNFRKQYTSLWMDSMNSSISQMTGNCDAAAASCTYFGRIDEFMTGHIGKVVRAEYHRINDDRMVFEMFDSQPGGAWFKVMSIAYVRQE